MCPRQADSRERRAGWKGKSGRMETAWVYRGGQSYSETWLGEPASSSLVSDAPGSVGRCRVKELARLTASHHNQGGTNVERKCGSHQKPSKEHEGKAGPDHELETPTSDSCHQSQEVGDRTHFTFACLVLNSVCVGIQLGSCGDTLRDLSIHHSSQAM